MSSRIRLLLLVLILATSLISTPVQSRQNPAAIILQSGNLKSGRSLTLDGLFYETAAGRTPLPTSLTGGVRTIGGARWSGETRMPDGRSIRLTVSPEAGAFTIALTATPRDGILKWGVALEAYLTSTTQDCWNVSLTDRSRLRGRPASRQP